MPRDALPQNAMFCAAARLIGVLDISAQGRQRPLRCRYWETEVSSGDQLQHLIDNPNLLGDQRQYGFSLPKLSEPREETVARGTSSDGTSPATMSETLAPSTVDPVFTFEHVSAGVRSVHCNVLCSTEGPSECTSPASASPFATCALAFGVFFAAQSGKGTENRSKRKRCDERDFNDRPGAGRTGRHH